jgi:hypothetical protein
LWTAGRLAEHYDVDPSFVYQHADELGCIRLGGGKCARLRFDPNVVHERLPTVGRPQAAPPRARPRSSRGRRKTPGRDDRNFDLLDFDRDP